MSRNIIGEILFRTILRLVAPEACLREVQAHPLRFLLNAQHEHRPQSFLVLIFSQKLLRRHRIRDITVIKGLNQLHHRHRKPPVSLHLPSNHNRNMGTIQAIQTLQGDIQANIHMVVTTLAQLLHIIKPLHHHRHHQVLVGRSRTITTPDVTLPLRRRHHQLHDRRQPRRRHHHHHRLHHHRLRPAQLPLCLPPVLTS